MASRDVRQHAGGGELAGRLALVTGAGSGIGRGIATVLARHGAAVVAFDQDAGRAAETAELVRAEGVEAHVASHDVRDWDAMPGVFARIAGEAGRPVDILVNNAGIYFSAPFEEMTEAQHRQLYDVNVTGVLVMCRAALPAMRERSFGKVVNIASISGRDPFPRSASYGSSKSAVLGITKSLAKEYAPFNVNVNAVCPGFVRTQMQIDQCRRIAAGTGADEDAVWQARVDLVPLRRAQEVEDIGEAVAFLASERARNITGQGLSVCGGLQMHG